MENQSLLKLNAGSKKDINAVLSVLTGIGYSREPEASRPGTFSLSGGNITIFSGNHQLPIRVEFFGSVVETIFDFDIKKGKIGRRYQEIIILANAIKQDDGTIIKPDDYVVHEDHGIGIFSHVETKKVDGENQTYYLIANFDIKAYTP